MMKTQHFQTLPSNIKSMFLGSKLNLSLLSFKQFKDPHDDRSVFDRRAIIFMDDVNNLVLKEFTARGRGDADINALLALPDNPFIPKIYVYEEYKFLVMEKAPGKDLLSLLMSKSITKEELKLVRDQFESGIKLILNSGWYYVDFKLQHLFWDRSTQQTMLIDYGIGDPFAPQLSEMIPKIIHSELENFDNEVDPYLTELN